MDNELQCVFMCLMNSFAKDWITEKAKAKVKKKTPKETYGDTGVIVFL